MYNNDKESLVPRNPSMVETPRFFFAFNALAAPIIFAVLSRIWGGKLHYQSKGACLGLLALCMIIPIVYFRWWLAGSRQVDRRWPLFTCVLTLAACIGGAVVGNGNYWSNGHILYQISDLASYQNVDPAIDVGQSFMDSGILYFKDGSFVDKSRAIAFKSYKMYCAAPIFRGDTKQIPKSGSIDFWAVGTDCCEADGGAFTCGEVKNNQARSGMRLVYSEHRPFYNLAVQEWEAQYHEPVKHPMFFEWVVDPVWNLQISESVLNSNFLTGALAFLGAVWASVCGAYITISAVAHRGGKGKAKLRMPVI